MNPTTTTHDSFDQIEQNSEDVEGIERRLDALETDGELETDGGIVCDTVDLGDDDIRQIGIGNQAGVRIEMAATVNGISARISPRTRGISNAVLKHDQGGDVIQEVDVTRHRSGDWVYFDAELEAEEAYELVADSDGRSFARGRRGGVDYPLEGGLLDVTHGIYTGGGAQSDTYRYCFDRLQPGADRSVREREFGALDDVPNDVEIVYAADELDLDADIGAEIQDLIDGLGEINHAIVLPETDCHWETHVQVPASAEFFGLIGEDDGPHCEIRESIDHPLTIGTWSEGVTATIVRGIDWDIHENDSDGYPVDTGFMQVFVQDWFVVEDCRRLGRRQRYQWRDGGGPFDGYYVLGNAYGFFANVLQDGAVGIVENVRTDGGVHNTRDPDDPIAERPGNPGEGIGFSAEISEGTIYWRDITGHNCVGNTFYMQTGQADGRNVVEHCEIVNGSRASIRLGSDDEAYNNYIEFSDMDGRYYGSGLWFEDGTPECDGLEIHAPDGNHELVRVSSGCAGGRIARLDVYAGGDNDHHTMRLSTTPDSPTDGIVVEDFHVVDESDGSTPNGNYSVNVSRPDVTLRNGTVDVSNSSRDAFGGSEEPELEDVEIVS